MNTFRQHATGIVYLVGAGPGDPELITVRGDRLLRACDAIVYDRLIHPHLIPSEVTATRYYVGKRDGDPASWTQEAINTLLIRLARAGQRVVRLKGGDPCVFGRGGEEGLALALHGIPFEIVPGVTAGTAVPAYAGIPVTHRGISTSVTFITANADPGRINAPIDWRAFGRVPGTLVVFMGARTFAMVAALLIDGGLDPDTPAAAIEWGTYAQQRTVVATVATLAHTMTASHFEAPVSIVVGEVVRLHETLAWFHPMQARHVDTRPVDPVAARAVIQRMWVQPSRTNRVGASSIPQAPHARHTDTPRASRGPGIL